MSPQLRHHLEASPRHSGAPARAKAGLEAGTGGNTLPWGLDCISKRWQWLCRWKAWPPHTAATRHVWHSGQNCAANTHGVIAPAGSSPGWGQKPRRLHPPALLQHRAAGWAAEQGRTGSSLLSSFTLLAQAHPQPLASDTFQVFLMPSVPISKFSPSEATEDGEKVSRLFLKSW